MSSAALCLLLTCTLGAAPQGPGGTRAAGVASDSVPRSAFVTASGIRLHYLDWGGAGETVLLLHGLGDRAARLAPLATELRGDFRVLGLDWRGHGESERPVTGYDTGTLVEDLRAFLDRLGVGRVTLIGHSLAGDQLTRFAGLYPDRVAKLVYLDAAFDRSDLPALFAEHPSPPRPTDDPVVRQLQRGSEASRPDYTKVAAPALSYFVIPDPDSAARAGETPAMQQRLRSWVTGWERPYVEKNVQRFRREMAHGCAVELRGTHHYFFLDEPGRYAAEIRRFLLDPDAPSPRSCPWGA